MAVMEMRAGQPKHPQYSVDAVRLSSYSKWPIASSQNPAMLCDAGFFYTGFGDCVRCFSCGGGLRNWQDGDVPFVEHARWYPDCDFLRRKKGDAFIKRHSHDEDRIDPDVPTVLPEKSIDTSECKQNVQIDVKEHDEAEKSGIAMRSVVEMGYSKSTVESCVEQLRKRGNMTFTAIDIMGIIFENENQRNNEHSTAKSHRPGAPEQIAPVASGTISLDKICGLPMKVSSPSDYQSLIKENKDLKEQMICKICLSNDACVVYLPCGHVVTCQQCTTMIRKCCICRQLIQDTVRAYL